MILVQIPRFYPILDVALIERRGFDVVETARVILESGARILQYRFKECFSRERFAEIGQVAKLCTEHGAIFVVNDRADVALMFDAALHLGQTDLSPVDARRVVGDAMTIGFSTHNEQQLLDAASQPADYLAFGPIFGTSSKLNPDPVVGLEGLRRARSLTTRPLVAIGGITRSSARSVLEAGADSVAVIGDLYPEDGDIGARVREWVEEVA